LSTDEIPQGEIFLVAEENPWVLVIGEILVGEKFGKFARLVEVVIVTVVFDAEVKAVAAITEQNEATVWVRAPRLGNRVGKVEAVATMNQDDGRWRHGDQF
jgi:hypothetical protein